MDAKSSSLTTIAIVVAYFLLVALVGWLARRRGGSAASFLHARQELPGWISAIAFLAANCGALEVVGMAAASAKYGALALHFYWIGAIPAMVFLALFVMPIYSASRARTIPEFLYMRYGPRVQLLNALSQIVMMIFVAGISLYAIGSVLKVFLGLNFFLTTGMTLVAIFFYVSSGGLPATIYTGLLQFGITLIGLIPLSYLTLRKFHGLHGLSGSLPETMRHAWINLSWSNPSQAPMDMLGIIFGLGFVLSFGYWCTDFVLMQRAFTAKTVAGTINTPLIAALGKLIFPLLLVAPGLGASILFRGKIENFDGVLPELMIHYYGPVLLGLGIAAILASLMSALAGNIAAVSTIWTHDIYRAYLRRHQEDVHYILVGRFATAAATCLSLCTTYFAFQYKNLLDYLQMVFSLFSAPLFAILVLGMFTLWATPGGAFWGLAGGMIVALLHQFAYHFSLLRYGSQMNANFYGALYGFVTSTAIVLGVSLVTERKPLGELDGVIYRKQDKFWHSLPMSSIFLASCVLILCFLLNYLFR